MERIYFLTQIRSKFGNKNGLECSSKSHELACAKIFHWKVWLGWAAEWRTGSDSVSQSSYSLVIEKFRADLLTMAELDVREP